MEFLFEVIFSIVFEGSLELLGARKVPMWLRVMAGVVAGGLFLLVVGLVGYFGVFILRENLLVALFLFGLDLLFVVFAVREILRLRRGGK